MKNKDIKIEFVHPSKDYEWWYNDDIILKVQNADNYEQAFELLSKFLLDLRTKKINIERGEEIFVQNDK